MAEKEKHIFSKKDIIFLIWFLAAVIQIHISILLKFVPINDIVSLLFWNGIIMLGEGFIAGWCAYVDA